MIIDISGILTCENKEITRKAEIELESFISRLGDFPIIEKAPVLLRIVNREGTKLTIEGDADLTVSIPCDRCLEEVPTRLCFHIDKQFSIENGTVSGEEAEDTDYLTGSGLDVEKLLYEEILVNWPMKVLCREDCKGICKVCGKNLNKGDCDCRKTELDPRMAAIQDIFNKFKEV